jgi:hypothetical protein
MVEVDDFVCAKAGPEAKAAAEATTSNKLAKECLIGINPRKI